MTMIDAEKVFEQVQQGSLPATWRLFRGKAGSAIGAGILTTIFTFLFIGVFAFIVCAAASTFGLMQSFSAPQYTSPSGQPLVFPANNFSPNPSPFDMFSNSPSLTTLLVLIVAAIAIACGVRVWLRTNNTRNSLLMLIPDGVIQYTNYDRPAKRSFKVISYGDLNDIEMKIDTFTQSVPNAAMNPSIRRTRINTHIWLDMQYRDGRHERWEPGTVYGRPETITHYILADFARYGIQEVH